MSLVLKILSGIGTVVLLVLMFLLDVASGGITIVISILACLAIAFFIDLKNKKQDKAHPET